MKILFVSHDDGKYGAALSLRKLIDLLKSSYDIEPIVITRKYNELNEFCSLNKIENYALHYVGCITYNCKNPFLKVLYSVKQNIKNNIFHHIAEYELMKRLDIMNIDVIYTNVSTIDFGAWLAKKYDKPHVWHIREFMDRDIKGCPASKNYYKLMNRSVAIVAISNAIRNAWVSKGIDVDRIHTIYNGVEDRYVDAKEKLEGVKNNNLQFVFLGSAAPHKGLEHLINAINIVIKNDYKLSLSVYGDYTNEFGNKMKEEVVDKGLSQYIKFCGFCPDMQKKLVNYDVGLVCSEAEAFGRVTVEFMINKLAVIATDSGANKELVENNVNGLLYPFGDSEKLAVCIEKLINQYSKTKEMGSQGRNIALNNFTAERNAENIYNLLLECLH